MFYKGYTSEADTSYGEFDNNLSFRNKTTTLSVNGSAITQTNFIMSDIDQVNRFIKDNAK